MIVADTSSLVSLAIADAHEVTLETFDVHTTDVVVGELEATAEDDDDHGRAAAMVLETLQAITRHEVVDHGSLSSRIDRGEASCLTLAGELSAPFLLTDDLRALPELQVATAARVVISPFVIRALAARGVLAPDAARDRVERLAATRDWVGAPIYRRALRLFDDVG